jgi:hypothetical protein
MRQSDSVPHTQGCNDDIVMMMTVAHVELVDGDIDGGEVLERLVVQPLVQLVRLRHPAARSPAKLLMILGYHKTVSDLRDF